MGFPPSLWPACLLFLSLARSYSWFASLTWMHQGGVDCGKYYSISADSLGVRLASYTPRSIEMTEDFPDNLMIIGNSTSSGKRCLTKLLICIIYYLKILMFIHYYLIALLQSLGWDNISLKSLILLSKFGDEQSWCKASKSSKEGELRSHVYWSWSEGIWYWFSRLMMTEKKSWFGTQTYIVWYSQFHS